MVAQIGPLWGVPPLSVNFFPLGFWEPTVRGGGEGGTPLSVKKKSIKNWPKNGVFWAKNAVFGEKISVFGNGPSVEGGGVPPFSVNFFPLTFRKNLVRGGPGGGGGDPPNGKFPCLWFLNPSLNRARVIHRIWT